MTKEDAVTALYITSIERHTGKDLLTMGLMNRMMKDGLKVGYFKPVGHFRCCQLFCVNSFWANF